MSYGQPEHLTDLGKGGGRVAALVCLVKQLHPVALMTLAGTLDDRGSLRAGLALRDCLAAQPAAVVVDAQQLQVIGDRPLVWLQRICQDAAVWPGAAVFVVDPSHSVTVVGARIFDSSDAAMAVAINEPLPRTHTVSLPPVAASCAAVRGLVRDLCTAWSLPRLSQAGELIASELVANGVIHAGTELVVSVREVGGLQISVADRDPRMVPEEPQYHGTGMEIVSGLSDRWGCLPTSSGKVVWACLNHAASTLG